MSGSKTRRHLRFLFGFGLLGLCAACATSVSTKGRVSSESLDDIVRSKPEVASELYAGDYVRVIEFTLPPGAALPAHEGKRRLVYSLNDYVLEWREGDGPIEEKTWSAGAVHAHEALAHQARNLGETTAEFLIVERLGAPLPETPPVDPKASGPPAVYTDSHFRVRRVRLAPGESVESHAGTYRAIYSLSDYTLSWQSNGATETKRWSKGQAHWHGPDEHAVSNVGESPAEWVVIEILD